MNYFCCDSFRRSNVMDHPAINGIDFLEVVDNPMDSYENRQTTLKVHFLKPLVDGTLEEKNIIIEGGERIRNIKVVQVSVASSSPASPPLSPPENIEDNILIVEVNEAGDFSTYTLKLVKGPNIKDVPDGFDQILSSVDFSFKVLCPSDFDCKPKDDCVLQNEKAPEINYLAKDYGSFRQVMLDRLSLLLPGWTESHPADIGITLVELLSYVGDYLSYQQDAIATEAYLRTARKRVSVRRHARLVDYFMNDGANARTWAHIEAGDYVSGIPLTKINNGLKTKFLTKGNNLPVVFRADSNTFDNALNQDTQVFEMLHDILLDTRFNQMSFYTWGQGRCCLQQGSTSATLDGDFSDLQSGQVLIFSEIAGPNTGKPGDADPGHRCAVLLTSVALSFDRLGTPGKSLDQKPVTEITWHNEDAPPFSLCVSAIDENGDTIAVSVAYGNNVLVDHGLSIIEELPPVPESGADEALLTVSLPATAPCKERQFIAPPLRYYPLLKQSPLTFAAVYQAEGPPESAFAVLNWNGDQVVPNIILEDDTDTGNWIPQRDLMNSGFNDKHFVVEVETDGTSGLRFGNDIQGAKPSGYVLTANYRIGNGLVGNVGANTLAHLVTNDPAITVANGIIKSIWNPLAGTGGKEQESIELVRQRAPYAFRKQERAVTMADYEEVSKRCKSDIQRSAATLRWTGSWRTVFLAVDRLNGQQVNENYREQLRTCIEKYRMAGQDLVIDTPVFVSLEISLVVCVNKNYFKSDVKAALLQVFSNRKLPDGQTGLFHPDNFSFGQPVFLSGIYAAAGMVEGVDSVRVTEFQRQGKNSTEALDSGKLAIERLEIARLDNDRNYPDHGAFNLVMQGGK